MATMGENMSRHAEDVQVVAVMFKKKALFGTTARQ